MTNQYKTSMEIITAPTFNSLLWSQKGSATDGSSFVMWVHEPQGGNLEEDFILRLDRAADYHWSFLQQSFTRGSVTLPNNSATQSFFEFNAIMQNPLTIVTMRMPTADSNKLYVGYLYPGGNSVPVVQSLYQQYIIADQQRGLDPRLDHVIPVKRKRRNVLAANILPSVTDVPSVRQATGGEDVHDPSTSVAGVQ